MGAKHFLLLSRINMVRRALRESTRAVATVIEIATRYGFWQFGRLAVEYRTLFGESPSASALDLPNPQHGQLPPSAVQVYVLDRTCQCLHRTGFRDRDPSCRLMEAGSAGVPGRASGLAWLEEHLARAPDLLPFRPDRGNLHRWHYRDWPRARVAGDGNPQAVRGARARHFRSAS